MRMFPESFESSELIWPKRAASNDNREPDGQPDHLRDGKNDPRASPSATGELPDEPEVEQESDVPLDGRDEIGEAMIRDLPRRPELTDSPSPPQSAPLHST